MRGFTAHEHIDAVYLIHMNGRAFDYRSGRFLSVDPLIQSPANSQSLNPYSYIMNNPLSGKDPSGYQSCSQTSAKDAETGDSCTFMLKDARSANKLGVMATAVVGGGGGATISAEGGQNFVQTGNGADRGQGPSPTKNQQVSAADKGRGSNNDQPAPYIQRSAADQQLQDDAQSITDRVWNDFKRDRNAPVSLEYQEILTVARWDIKRLREHEAEVGKYSELGFLDFLKIAREGTGDSLFMISASQGARYEISGGPPSMNGIVRGNDLNYYYQGFVWSAGGYSRFSMTNAIAAWNGKQARDDLGRGNWEEAKRNVRQIKQAGMWANWGYSFFENEQK